MERGGLDNHRDGGRAGAWLLIGLIVFCIALNLAWNALNTGIFVADEIHHVSELLLIKERTAAAVDLPGLISGLFLTSRFYPPLFYCLTLPLYDVTGQSPAAFYLMQLPFVALYLWGVFDFIRGRRGAPLGLAVAALSALSPLILFMSRHYYIDFPLAAAVAAFLAAHQRSDGFRNRQWSVIAGLLFAAGLLFKWTFPIFVLPAFLPIFQAGKREGGQAPSPAAAAINVALFALPVIFLALPWYWLSLDSILKTVAPVMSRVAEVEGEPPVQSFASLAYYLWTLKGYSFYPVFLLGLYGIFHAISSRERLRENLALLLLFVFPLIVFTLLRNKDCRYFAPSFFLFYFFALSWLDPARRGHRVVAAALPALVAAGAFLFWLPLLSQSPAVRAVSREYAVPTASSLGDDSLIRKGSLSLQDFLPVKGMAFVDMPPPRDGMAGAVKGLVLEIGRAGRGGGDSPEAVFVPDWQGEDMAQDFLMKSIPLYARIYGEPLAYHVATGPGDARDVDFVITWGTPEKNSPGRGFALAGTFGSGGKRLCLYRATGDD
jgi:hypothetical protein